MVSVGQGVSIQKVLPVDNMDLLDKCHGYGLSGIGGIMCKMSGQLGLRLGTATGKSGH